MTRQEIIKKVQAKLEELSPYDDSVFLVSNNNVKPIVSYIDESMDEATDQMLLLLPHHVIKEPKEYVSPVLTTDDGVGYIPVPSDFLKLHTIRTSSWMRDVNEAIGVLNPAYRLQRNKHTRGKFEKPVVAIANNQFELYSVKDDDTIEVLTYIPHTKAEELADELVPYAVDVCAYMVYDIIENSNQSKLMQQELADKITSITI